MLERTFLRLYALAHASPLLVGLNRRFELAVFKVGIGMCVSGFLAGAIGAPLMFVAWLFGLDNRPFALAWVVSGVFWLPIGFAVAYRARPIPDPRRDQRREQRLAKWAALRQQAAGLKIQRGR